MKNRGYMTAILGILVLLGNCANVLSPGGGGDSIPQGKGRLAINLENEARTALPSGTFDRYMLSFDYNGQEGYNHDDVEWTSDGFTVDLEPGSWTIHADAYVGDEDILSGTGSKTITVVAGSSISVTIYIGINAGPEGTLTYRVSYPAGDDHVYGSQKLIIVGGPGGTQVGSDININNGAQGGPLSLPAGTYLVTALIENTKQRTQAARTVSVHIYGGKTTELEIAIEESEFSASVPIDGTADVTVGATYSEWKISAYSDSNCSELLDTVNPTDAGHFILMTPSKHTTVYLRQEVAISGTTYPGKAQQESLPSDGTPLTGVVISDAFYSISINNIPSGQVIAPAYHAVGVPLALTVNMQGFIIKPNTFKYNDGTNNYPLDSPPYTFTISNTAVTIVTITGDFVSESYTRYVAEGGTGFGLSWEDASGDLQKMMDELAYLHSEDYDGPFLVKLAAGTYKPQWMPMIPASGAPYTYSAGGRDAAFILREGVKVQGGYDSSTGNHNITTNISILNGDFGDDDTISGSGSALTISGNSENAYHVVLAANIPANSAALDGLTITGGNANGSQPPGDSITVDDETIYRALGGGMYNVGSSPSLENVTISGNNASAGGGMVNIDSSSPGLTSVTISDNTASDGGGMYNSLSSSPALTSVTISGNTATGGGGGMSNLNSSSPTLTSVTISGNTATDGGGVYNVDSPSTLANVTISGNTATDGGGIYNEDSSPSLENVTISGNTATNGGGMYNINQSGQTEPVLTNVTIAGNSATNGGGIYNFDASSPRIKNSIIWGNTAGTQTSGIDANNGGGATPVISYSIVQGWTGSGTNVSDTDDPFFVEWKDPLASGWTSTTAGDYHLLPTSPAIKAGEHGVDMGAHNTDYSAPEMTRYVREEGAGHGAKNGSSWANASGDLQMMMDQLAALGGGTVKLAAGTYKPRYEPNSDGTTNYATVSGSRDVAFILREGVKVEGGYDSSTGNRNIATNITTLSGDFADDDEIDVDVDASPAVSISNNTENAYHVVLAVNIPANSGTALDGLTIAGGSSTPDYTSPSPPILDIDQNYGGGIYNHNASPVLTNVTLSRNIANGGNGGGMYNYNASPTLTHVTISDNVATNGGGMYNEASSPVLTDVTITGNTAGNEGGGMYNLDSSPTLINVTIAENNSLDGSGGGMYNETSSPTLTDVTIADNFSVMDGGGMYNEASSPVLTDVTITDNIADGDGGGGIYNEASSPMLSNVQIIGNTGGGMYNLDSSPMLINVTISGNNSIVSSGGGMINETSSPTLTDVTITDNTTTGSGGGIFNWRSSPVLTNVRISGNTAASGGGIYNWDGSSPVLTNVLISGNTADDGGGIQNWIGSSPVLTNVNITGNYAANNGGAINNHGSSPVLTNVTIAGNYAANNGGGMYNTYNNPNNLNSDPQIRNSIIWGNLAGTNTAGIDGDGTGTPVIEYSDVQGWNTGTGNLNVDPNFVSLVQATANATTAGDYRLSSGSQAIDVGNNSYYPNSAGDIAALTGRPLNFFPAGAQGAINRALATDLDGKVRKRDTIDMGAYENQGSNQNQNNLAAITLIFGDRGSGAFSQDSFSISKSNDDEKTITITGSGYDNPRWFVDGAEKGNGNDITLRAADYSPGGHSLSLWVIRDNKLWSKELAFTVRN